MKREKVILFLIVLVFVSSCKIILSRKTSDAINNPLAYEYYSKAQEQGENGSNGFQNAIDLLNKADSLEPKNAIIISERGMLKFNSKLDVKGAFIDFENAFAYSTDKRNISFMHHNRGLFYMNICDIKSACADWKKAGKSGSFYVEKYCKNCSDTTFNSNKDGKIEVVLDLVDKSTKITSSHNSPSMSESKANIIVRNNNNEELEIFGSSLDYGLFEDSCSMYLEAQYQSGEKFIFFTNTIYSYYPTNKKQIVIKKGESYSQEQNITFLHQFPYSGIYKVRVALRSSNILKGTDSTYYSNWETLTVE